MLYLNKGEIILTDVDFENTEAQHNGMGHNIFFSEGVSDDQTYDAVGIITSTKNTSAEPCNFLGVNNVPAPCGRFIWKGGSVTGHNIDMNPGQDNDERFNPFLNLNRIDEV